MVAFISWFCLGIPSLYSHSRLSPPGVSYRNRTCSHQLLTLHHMRRSPPTSTAWRMPGGLDRNRPYFPPVCLQYIYLRACKCITGLDRRRLPEYPPFPDPAHASIELVRRARARLGRKSHRLITPLGIFALRRHPLRHSRRHLAREQTSHPKPSQDGQARSPFVEPARCSP